MAPTTSPTPSRAATRICSRPAAPTPDLPAPQEPIMTMTADTPETTLKDGRVVAIAGPVVDVEFPPDALPELNHAVSMVITIEGNPVTVLAEVAQHLGEGRVRAICLKPTDGLKRGATVVNTGHGLRVPVGTAVLGHVWNVWGDPLDGDPAEFENTERWEI